MQYMLEAEEWWHGPLGCRQCFLVPLVSSPHLLFCVLPWHLEWDEGGHNSRQEQRDTFRFVYKIKNRGKYIFKYSVGRHASTHKHTHTFIPRHLTCLYWQRYIDVSSFLHNRRFLWSCDQYFATQIFKGPREAYDLKEIYYDSSHKPIFANINNHT